MNNIWGYIGAFLFCLCALPQIIKALKTKSTKDLSWSFLLLWLGGEIFSLISIMVKPELVIPILINYIINLLSLILLIIIKIKYDTTKIN